MLYGYALFYDLAADESQKALIAAEVDELMTHLLDNHCRIIDVDGEPTQWGHVGIDPDPQYDAYYQEMYGKRFRRFGERKISEFPLRSQLMLLPDLLIAHHITGKPHYLILNLGVSGYLTKPFRVPEVLKAALKALGE